MAKNKLVQTNEKIARAVTQGYQKIEAGVVGGYKKIEAGAVEGFSKVSDAFVEQFLARDGESTAQAKERLAREQARRAGRQK